MAIATENLRLLLQQDLRARQEFDSLPSYVRDLLRREGIPACSREGLRSCAGRLIDQLNR